MSTTPTPNDTPTPRTDKLELGTLGATWAFSFRRAIELARTLELELAQAKAECEARRKAVKDFIDATDNARTN